MEERKYFDYNKNNMQLFLRSPSESSWPIDWHRSVSFLQWFVSALDFRYRLALGPNRARRDKEMSSSTIFAEISLETLYNLYIKLNNEE